MFEHKDIPSSIALCSPSLYRVLRGNNYLTLVRTHARTADPPLSFVLSLHPLYFGFLFFCHFFLSLFPLIPVSQFPLFLCCFYMHWYVRAYVHISFCCGRDCHLCDGAAVAASGVAALEVAATVAPIFIPTH